MRFRKVWRTRLRLRWSMKTACILPAHGLSLERAGPRNDTFMAVRGQLGAATWGPVGDGLLSVYSSAPAWQGAPERQFNMPVPPRPVYADQFGYEYVADFVRTVREGGKPVVSIDDAHHLLQIFDAAYESSTGRRVDIQ